MSTAPRALSPDMRLAKLIISQIVDKYSACLGLPFEAAVGIGSADHRDVCKFDDASSQKYLPVKNAIEELVEFGTRQAAEEYE